jgi:hypothetical protein
LGFIPFKDEHQIPNYERGKNMATMDFQGKQIEVDDDRYLLNLDDWNKDLAVELASRT